MSVLVFDVDQSLASIGPAPKVNELFIIPPLTIEGGLVPVLACLKEVFDSRTVPMQHPIFTHLKVPTTSYELNASAKKLEIQAIMVDSVSHLQRQDLRILEAARAASGGQMEIQDWGKLGRMYGLFFEAVKRYPIPVILTSHMGYDKDENSVFHYGPKLKGAAGDDIQEFFDVVLFTKVGRDKAGQPKYSWITRPERQKEAKDRLSLLEPEIPQDFGPVLQAYEDAGWTKPKILVIGNSGTGKTRSLATAASYFQTKLKEQVVT